MLVFFQQPLRFFQRVASEGVSELLRCHALDDGAFVVADGFLQRVSDILRLVYDDSLRAHGLGDLGKRGVGKVGADESVGVEIDLVLFLRPPLSVVEDDGCDRNVLAYASQRFLQAHPPCSVADIGDSRTLRTGDLRADGGGKGVSAVAETHGSEETLRLVKAQVGVGDRTDVADIGCDHGVFGHGAFEFAQDSPWRDGGSVLLPPIVEFIFPFFFLFCDLGEPLLFVRLRFDRRVRGFEAMENILGCGFGIGADAEVGLLDEPEHARIAVDLDELGVLRPIVDTVLWQRSEGA